MATMDAAITTRLPKGDKEAVTSIVETLGFDVPSVTRAFYLQIIRTGHIPLDMTVETYNTEDPAFLESEAFFASGRAGSYTDTAEMLADILAKD
ncbi:hypothetical protein QJ043_04225 [Olsenella sp. YH-ols2217]|uniref:Type II toxin-antitoxin system RelB/DinJ family antitoxin n=1 Tax=Kribbibacterium absianum TaxID=3044210 RepID=A0ABT6ZJS9_9ACTN|nr:MULTISPECIES: hypothetical protein [unclassified Olsenella]MDJ1122461.1 hypothetical protein [Olsenella sp. YH-ols2216]MDJ1129285.1 hypothetical protein [Olsenella sp. YH-ols2217]